MIAGAVDRNWDAFDGFVRPERSASWDGVTAWIADVQSLVGAERHTLAQARWLSDERLADLGGDPTARDWTAFLPLRRDREEDWSDWLAQLIEDSATGYFAWALLAGHERQSIASYGRAKVQREAVYANYRADLIVEWHDRTYTHVEVKVGDPSLFKTLATSRAIERDINPGCTRRSDVLLLLPSQENAWLSECSRESALQERIHRLTWVDVALALRRALRAATEEPVQWQVWAHAFCGAVEQDLLGMRAGRDPAAWSETLSFQNVLLAARLFASDGEK